MPFKYRLQKVLDFRIRKKEEQLQVVIKAQEEVYKKEQLIEQNNQNISTSKENMRHADFRMLEAYDNYIKHLYEVGEELEKQKQEALEALEAEKEKLVEKEKEVKVLEKHKEKMLEAYKDEEKKAELKRLSEVAVQKHFAKMRDKREEEEEELEQKRLNNPEGDY